MKTLGNVLAEEIRTISGALDNFIILLSADMDGFETYQKLLDDTLMIVNDSLIYIFEHSGEHRDEVYLDFQTLSSRLERYIDNYSLIDNKFEFFNAQISLRDDLKDLADEVSSKYKVNYVV